MKQDIELERKILFEIEKQYPPGQKALWLLKIDGYDMATIAEHRAILHDKGFIRSYEPGYANGRIQSFSIGNISANGYDYLELIRSDEVWEKTKKEIEKRQLPQTFETIAKIAGIFVGNVISQMSGLQ